MPGRSYTGNGYRYGFNTQEKTDEVSGNGNHTTAEFWEYDTRLGRRWNLDIKPVVGNSQYSTLKNNPVLFFDHKGDSAFVSKNISPEVMKAYLAFASTKEGKKAIGNFAAKGQTVFGITFSQDGKYNQQGNDVLFDSAPMGTEGANGETDTDLRTNTKSERRLVTITINEDLNETSEAKLYSKALSREIFSDGSPLETEYAKTMFILARTKTIFHEVLIHGELAAQGVSSAFMDDHKVAWGEAKDMFHQDANGKYTVIYNPNARSLYYYHGWNAMKTLHKRFNSGYSDRQIFNQLFNVSDD